MNDTPTDQQKLKLTLYLSKSSFRVIKTVQRKLAALENRTVTNAEALNRLIKDFDLTRTTAI
ncbi:hypothetical protein NO559_10395 [Dasania sp. GY-MA-18]|uniref:Uncharacterized protein n=1 Tax=Dasania phycosphaerae TaxID=2950436 RepID=A0A9J6RN53_9GAMM|nr:MULTISPECIES: hypothetical protein [Dasania]MCR8923184.1 hypothetical protein [Dasania sp. GY-MA-18]MCZ0865616.1 hypothetical protein [Dasania phycosphaerae]MCZ0869341.1 hypothetical protein [Dasania phycosphaerae]